jgi:hypothetical protein
LKQLKLSGCSVAANAYYSLMALAASGKVSEQVIMRGTKFEFYA